jgi:hypothetical protein
MTRRQLSDAPNENFLHQDLLNGVIQHLLMSHWKPVHRADFRCQQLHRDCSGGRRPHDGRDSGESLDLSFLEQAKVAIDFNSIDVRGSPNVLWRNRPADFEDWTGPLPGIPPGDFERGTTVGERPAGWALQNT